VQMSWLQAMRSFSIASRCLRMSFSAADSSGCWAVLGVCENASTQAAARIKRMHQRMIISTQKDRMPLAVSRQRPALSPDADAREGCCGRRRQPILDSHGLIVLIARRHDHEKIDIAVLTRCAVRVGAEQNDLVGLNS